MILSECSRIGSFHCGFPTFCYTASACCYAMGLESNTGVSRDHSNPRRWTDMFALCLAEALCSGFALDVVVHWVVGIMSWPSHLRLIGIRGGVEGLLVVGLVVLRILGVHPAIVHLHVMELRA
jgi:hypothetical protein